MNTDLPDLGLVERAVKSGIKIEIEKIIDEEAKLAQERVASRVHDMKQGAIGRALARFKYTQVQSPEAWTYHLKFEL